MLRVVKRGFLLLNTEVLITDLNFVETFYNQEKLITTYTSHYKAKELFDSTADYYQHRSEGRVYNFSSLVSQRHINIKASNKEKRMKSIWLMYHDVYAKGPAPGIPRSAAMYHVSKDLFAQHLFVIRASGRYVITASEFAHGCDSNSVVMTFDDGWRGAMETVIPMLQEFGFRATFFITQDFVGRKGFCDQSLILKAVNAGMEVGAHGRTHRMLSCCSREEIMWELSTCKEFLESILQRRIVSASMPGGDWNEEIAS